MAKKEKQQIATYRIGVDILGFPIYVEHHIFRGEITRSKFNPYKTKWVKIIAKIIKQH